MEITRITLETSPRGGGIPVRAIRMAFLLVIAALALTVATGCGSKPQYCTDRTTLENDVKSLPSAATSSGVNGLKTQVTTIQSDAKALVSSAKSDFPSESSAVESAVTQLQNSLQDLPAKPSTSQIAAIAINASAVVNSVKAFSAAVQNDCK